jgi:hypothetical protein
MEQHEVTHLETRIKDLCRSLASVANDKDFMALLPIIHRPGWTTVAEAMLVKGLIDAMHAHTQTLAELKQVLVKGSHAVEVK